MSTVVTLENREGLIQVFNLPHERYCAAIDACTCRDQTVTTMVENPATGDRTTRTVTRRLPASVTLLAGDRWAGQPAEVLRIPEIQRAVERGALRVVTPRAEMATAAAKREHKRQASNSAPPAPAQEGADHE